MDDAFDITPFGVGPSGYVPRMELVPETFVRSRQAKVSFFYLLRPESLIEAAPKTVPTTMIHLPSSPFSVNFGTFFPERLFRKILPHQLFFFLLRTNQRSIGINSRRFALR